MVRKLTAAVVLAAFFGGCSASSSSGSGTVPAPPAVPARLHPVAGDGKIQHVVIIIQENRTFDNLFQGYPGADTVSSGKNSQGQTIKLRAASLAEKYNLDHSINAMVAACNGTGSLPGTQCRMNGFDRINYFGGPPNPSYVYVPHSESKPYFDMAHQWVLADHNFQSHLDESFVGHQFLIAAQADDSVDLPYREWGCDGGDTDLVATVTAQRQVGPAHEACFDYDTIADELTKAHLSWRFYSSNINPSQSGGTGVWSAFQAVRHIRYGSQWSNVVTPQADFLVAVQSKLASVTWITPVCSNSDHVNCGGGYGPSWVASLVNAIGKSKFWNSTAIFVVWDDWGGLYDHVPPPYKDRTGLGFRVPLLIISPYAKQNYVSHVQYESSSILTFTEDVFGLPRLAAADARATSPADDCFDFTKPPRPFVKIRAPRDASFFLHQPADLRPPDDE